MVRAFLALFLGTLGGGFGELGSAPGVGFLIPIRWCESS